MNSYPPTHYPQSQVQPSQHSQYDPSKWIFYVRCAQFVLTILVIGLAGYAASQSVFTSGPMISFWTITWSMIYVPCTVFFIPKIPSRYRPNIIVLVLECFSWFWWLLTFILLAEFSTWAGWTADVVTTTETLYGTSNPYDLGYGNLIAAAGCTKAATAFAAFNYLLFKASFVGICIRIHRQHKARLAGNSNYGVEAGANGAAIEVSQFHAYKTDTHTQAQEVRL